MGDWTGNERVGEDVAHRTTSWHFKDVNLVISANTPATKTAIRFRVTSTISETVFISMSDQLTNEDVTEPLVCFVCANIVDTSTSLVYCTNVRSYTPTVRIDLAPTRIIVRLKACIYIRWGGNDCLAVIWRYINLFLIWFECNPMDWDECHYVTLSLLSLLFFVTLKKQKKTASSTVLDLHIIQTNELMSIGWYLGGYNFERTISEQNTYKNATHYSLFVSRSMSNSGDIDVLSNQNCISFLSNWGHFYPHVNALFRN